jgi:hypothetical protein
MVQSLAWAGEKRGESIEVIVEFKGGTLWRFRFAPQFDYRITHAELVSPDDTSHPAWVYQYGWRRDGDDVAPEEVVVQVYDYWQKSGGLHTHRMLLSEFRAESRLKEEEYDLAALDLCKGSRLIDYRSEAATPLRNVTPDALAGSAEKETLAAQAEALPVRHVRPPPPANPPERRWGLVWSILGINAAVILVLVGGWWLFWRR